MIFISLPWARVGNRLCDAETWHISHHMKKKPRRHSGTEGCAKMDSGPIWTIVGSDLGVWHGFERYTTKSYCFRGHIDSSFFSCTYRRRRIEGREGKMEAWHAAAQALDSTLLWHLCILTTIEMLRMVSRASCWSLPYARCYFLWHVEKDVFILRHPAHHRRCTISEHQDLLPH
jgi:hypothetical protein